MSSKKNNFDLVFVGDSYTQGYGLWYYYWCKNKLLVPVPSVVKFCCVLLTGKSVFTIDPT